MNRRWLKGEPKPSGCIGDLFGKDSTPGPTDEKADFVGKLAKCKADVKKADLLFDELDADKSGTVDENELRQLIVKLGRKASDEEAKKMMSYMDADGQGTVDKSEFLTYFEQLDELFVIHSDGTKVSTRIAALGTDFALLQRFHLSDGCMFATELRGHAGSILDG